MFKGEQICQITLSWNKIRTKEELEFAILLREKTASEVSGRRRREIKVAKKQ